MLYSDQVFRRLLFRCFIIEDFKLEKGPTDKAKEPDPGGSDQQNLGFKKLKNRKTDRMVGCISNAKVQSNRTVSFSVFQLYYSLHAVMWPFCHSFSFALHGTFLSLKKRHVSVGFTALLQALLS